MNLVWALAILVISYAITALTTKVTKPKDAIPSRINEFVFPTFGEGTPQAVMFGECWTSDWMVLYYGNLSTESIRAKEDSSKKK